MTPTYFLVDEMDESGTSARTSNYDKFLYNMQLLGTDVYKEFHDELSKSRTGNFLDAIPCGRYVMLIIKSNNKAETGMVFYDFKNDEDRLSVVVSKLDKYAEGKIYKSKILKAFLLLKPLYESICNDVELSLDSSALN